jgi:transcriptional regulator with XRE-family HTH domain
MTTTAVTPSGGAPSQLIAREIRAELGRKQLTARRFAMRLGVSYMWVTRRLNSGEVPLTFEDVDRIATALEVPPAQFVSAWLPRMDSNHQPAGYSGRRRTGQLPSAA